MLLAGDDLTKISAEKLSMLRKLQPPTGVAARFGEDTLRVGVMKLATRYIVAVFNWEDKPQTISFRLQKAVEVTDFYVL